MSHDRTEAPHIETGAPQRPRTHSESERFLVKETAEPGGRDGENRVWIAQQLARWIARGGI